MPRRKPSEVLDAIANAKPIDIEEVASEMLEAFGGPRGYAEKCLHEYQREGTPATARVKLLDGVGRLAAIASGKNKAEDEDGLRSDEELKAIILEASVMEDGEIQEEKA